MWSANINTTLKTAAQSPGTRPMRLAMILDATKTAVGAQKLVTPEAWHAQGRIELNRNIGTIRTSPDHPCS